MAGFEDLDDDVLYLILDYLYLERASVLHNLRLTSSRLKEFSDAIAHRRVSLIDDDVHEQITYRLAERLSDPSDKICHYVRDLSVVNFKGDAESCCLNNALIADCLRHVQKLDSFSWQSDAPIPLKTLDILQQRFPRAQLSANVRTIDSTLLSAKQLHRLEVSVPGQHFSQTFKQVLLCLTSLRHLSVDTYPDAKLGQAKDEAPNHVQRPLQPVDKLPSLVSLELRSKTYAFDLDHCESLHASMDCNKLQRLTIGSPNAVCFFQIFKGNLPNLTYLDVSYASSRIDPRHRRLESLTGFVNDLGSLKSLTFRCDKLDLRADFAKMLSDTRGPTLEYLSLQARQDNTEGPSFAGNIRKFLLRFTNLHRLDLAFPNIRSYHRCSDCDGYRSAVSYTFHHYAAMASFDFAKEDTHFSFVPPLPSLQSINLSVRAPSSDRPLYASVNRHAHCAILHLWLTFAKASCWNLETLSIRFWRWESTGRQTRLKELVYDTARLRGQLEVKVRHHREIPVVAYPEVWGYNWCMGTYFDRFEVDNV